MQKRILSSSKTIALCFKGISRRSSTVLPLLLIAALLTTSSSHTFAQTPRGAPAPRNKRQFVANNKAAWQALNTGVCDGATTSDACAQASIVLAATECGGSARFFQRANTTWQVVNLLMILASAGFTAVGASTTIASARLFATLGGTTGLGAITTTINANASGDVAGLTVVNTTLTNFLIFLKTGAIPGVAPGAPAAGNTPPDNATIYKFAPLFGSQCEAAATSSGK